jgi:hypothetical protein
LGKVEFVEENMMRKVLPVLFAGALFSFVIAQSALAATVIDQDAFAPPLSGPPLNGRIVTTLGNPTPNLINAIAGQTVTAGIAGRLDSIELQGFRDVRPSTIFATIFGLTIYDGDLSAGGRIIGTVNGQVPVGGTAASTFVNVASLGYNLLPGQLFSFSIAIVGGLPSASANIIIGNFAGAVPPAPPPILNFNDYARGRRFLSSNGSPFFAQINGDLGFRTFVDTAITGVPEPESWAMMIFGFGFIGAVSRRRRQARLSAV